MPNQSETIHLHSKDLFSCYFNRRRGQLIVQFWFLDIEAETIFMATYINELMNIAVIQMLEPRKCFSLHRVHYWDNSCRLHDGASTLDMLLYGVKIRVRVVEEGGCVETSIERLDQHTETFLPKVIRK